MEELKNPQERINMILEKESELTDLQLNAAAHAREIRTLREKNRSRSTQLKNFGIHKTDSSFYRACILF